MRKNFILISIAVLAISCTKSKYYERTYYSNGNIKEELEYHSKKDRDNFIAVRYSKNGELLENVEYINGLKDGKHQIYNKSGKLKEVHTYKDGYKEGVSVIYSEDGAVKILTSCKNNLLHGIVRKYNSESEIKQEFLYLYGSKVIFNQYYGNQELKIDKVVSFVVDTNDVATSQGQLLYNSISKKPIEDMSFFYEVETNSDTIRLGETCNVNVRFVNEKPWKLILQLGELDKYLDFVTPLKEYKSSGNIIDFTVTPTEVGNYLILGKLVVSPQNNKEDYLSESFELVVYHQIFVKY